MLFLSYLHVLLRITSLPLYLTLSVVTTAVTSSSQLVSPLSVFISGWCVSAQHSTRRHSAHKFSAHVDGVAPLAHKFPNWALTLLSVS